MAGFESRLIDQTLLVPKAGLEGWKEGAAAILDAFGEVTFDIDGGNLVNDCALAFVDVGGSPLLQGTVAPGMLDAVAELLEKCEDGSSIEWFDVDAFQFGRMFVEDGTAIWTYSEPLPYWRVD